MGTLVEREGVQWQWVSRLAVGQSEERVKRYSHSESGTTRRRRRRLPAIAPGKRASVIEKEVLINTNGSGVIRTVTFYTYDCPSNVCEFTTGSQCNKNAAYDTLLTHIREDHRA